MKKAFDEVLCIRGSGAFQRGVCYPIVGGNIVVYSRNAGTVYGFHPNQTLTGEKGVCLEILHGLEQSGARFVYVKRRKRNGNKDRQK